MTNEYHRIGRYPIEDIKRATVIVRLEDEFGKTRDIPFSFKGETFEHGEHCKLYMNRKDVEALSDIKALQNPFKEGDVQNVYRFHKEDILVKSEDDIYYEKQRY